MSLPPLTFNAWLRHDLIWDALEGLDVSTVLEIGAGGGAMGARLAHRYSYVGIEADLNSFATAHARVERPGLGRVLNGDLSALDAGAEFDLVCAFEVLEHIENDDVALKEWHDRIRPGGWLLLSVPAYQRRFGPWDRKVGHYRRYDPTHMRQLLRSSGFVEPQIWLYGFPLGYPLEWIRDALARASDSGSTMGERTSASGRRLQPPGWLGEITALLTAPFRVLQRPFIDGAMGTGLVVRARRGA